MTEIMAMQCPQKLMYFLSSFGPFRTALMFAVIAGDLNIIQILLRHGANPLCIDHLGSTAMSYARIRLNPE